jgi:CubicO group peptidase (beta-lactamase class C family)
VDNQTCDYGGVVDDPRQRLDAAASECGFSGVVRVDRDGTVEIDAAYGLADRAHTIAMTTDTQLGMASGSKTFTAVVVLKLVEDGLLDLSMPARALLGRDLPLIADDVTVEHLLCHRSGIGDYLDEDVLDSDDYPMPVSVHRLVRTEDFVPILDGYPTKFPAGDRFSYCNGGYVVLALLAERASGRSYQDLVRDIVCKPAGMSSTDFLRSDSLPGTAALGYVEVDGYWRTNVFHLPVVATGDGGVYTTSADITRFWDALMTGRLIGHETRHTMLTPRSPVDEDGDGYALGCWARPGPGIVQMSGGDAGVRFWSRHDPRDGSTITVIGNSGASSRPLVKVLDDLLS